MKNERFLEGEEIVTAIRDYVLTKYGPIADHTWLSITLNHHDRPLPTGSHYSARVTWEDGK